jgi:membrane-bound metal-dependent hydrolase YbcI (DUF457 family)
VAKPFGHTVVGMLIARRLGVRSPEALLAAGLAANLPDLDVIPGVLGGDPWKFHRKATHTLGFGLTAGMLAGIAGVISAGSAEGERDLIADALAGALIVGSHAVIDRAPVPYMKVKKDSGIAMGMMATALNWAGDAALYGALAWLLWPRDAQD